MKQKIIFSLFLAALFSVPLTIHAQVQMQFPTTVFTKLLKVGTTDSEVTRLQDYLRQFPELYPEGQITGFFGTFTKNAVKRFQIREGLKPLGIVGPATRLRLNQLVNTGAVSNIGPAGPAGATGATGTAGSILIVGGGSGATGATGNAGATGATGVAGDTGATGSIGLTGNTGIAGTTGATGANGTAGINGTTGGVGATGSTGATGNAGAVGATGNTGTTGVTGATGAVGSVGATGSIGATGSVGANGSNGSTGAAGTNGATGSAGTNGSTGATGAAGATGPAGATGATGPAGTIASALYVQLGSQPATIGPGQPFTYSTTILSTPGITASTAVFNPPFTANGTIFTLANIGRYEIHYQMTYPTDGGVVLYFGSAVATMAPLAYTMIGKTPDSAVSGSVIIQTTSTNSFVSVNAAPGNAAAIGIPPNTSTTNQSATTVSFKQIQ
jgi:collagen type VII alpha